MEPVTGHCLCGEVQFGAEGRPFRVGLCHCRDCRRHHGALFYAAAVYPQRAVTIAGETRNYAGGISARAVDRQFSPAVMTISNCIWAPWMMLRS